MMKEKRSKRGTWYGTAGTSTLSPSRTCCGVVGVGLVSACILMQQIRGRNNVELRLKAISTSAPPLASFDSTGVVMDLDPQEVERLDARTATHAAPGAPIRRAFVTLLVHTNTNTEDGGSAKNLQNLQTYADAALTMLHQLQLAQDVAATKRARVPSVLAVTPDVPLQVRREAAALGIEVVQFQQLFSIRTGEARYAVSLALALFISCDQPLGVATEHDASSHVRECTGGGCCKHAYHLHVGTCRYNASIIKYYKLYLYLILGRQKMAIKTLQAVP